MSTRAVIAKQTKEGWDGVYQHSDGYPTGLGRELWTCLHNDYRGDLDRFVRDVIDAHPGGWSHFAKSVPIGKWDDYAASGYATEFFANHAVRECYCHSEYFARRDGSCAPDSQYYRADAPSGRITYDPASDGANGLEWAYCFGPGSLAVFQALPHVRHLGDGYQLAPRDAYQHQPHAWQVIAVYSLRGPEPDWGVVECGRSYQRCRHLAWAHLDGSERERVISDPQLSKLSMCDYVRSNREC